MGPLRPFSYPTLTGKCDDISLGLLNYKPISQNARYFPSVPLRGISYAGCV